MPSMLFPQSWGGVILDGAFALRYSLRIRLGSRSVSRDGLMSSIRTACRYRRLLARLGLGPRARPTLLLKPGWLLLDAAWGIPVADRVELRMGQSSLNCEVELIVWKAPLPQSEQQFCAQFLRFQTKKDIQIRDRL